MFRAIILQVIVTVVATIAAGAFAGVRGAVSAAAGGGVCIVPNLLFALRLRSLPLHTTRTASSYSLNFMLGELFKLTLTFALLAAVVRIYTELHWPSMLIGLVLASQAMFLAFWKRADHVDRS